MTAYARLLDLRNTLRAAIGARALLIGVSVSVSVFLLLAIFMAQGVAIALSITVGAAVTAYRVRRMGVLRSLSSVALWVEESAPALRYALVSVADGVSLPALERQALATPWWEVAKSMAWRALVAPAIVLVLSLGLLAWRPFGTMSMGSGGRSATGRSGPPRVSDVLAIMHVNITPPAYSGRPSSDLDAPTSVEALVGSAIAITGLGNARLITATADSQSRSVAQRGEGWSLSLSMPVRPAIVRLHTAAGRDRLLVLAPVTDEVPAVTLTLPARDSIVRRASGVLPLHARLRDDIGLNDGAFELIVISGGGENFTFRTGRIGGVQLGNRAEGELAARLSLDSLKLQPGDILQIRASAHDRNNINGPGIGSSETRAIRIARPDEYDSVSVEQLPPPDVEGQVLSQRMLINITEALVRKQSQLSRPLLVDEARKIASDQAKLRKHVGDIVFQRLGAEPLSEEGAEPIEKRGKLTAEDIIRMADSVTNNAGEVLDVEGDETPILAINKPLLEAFNAMWDAGRALEVGEPAKALPPMRIALAAIQKARIAERIYLRGGAGKDIVDVAKVRMTGKDKGVASLREARAPVSPVARRRSETFERVTNLIARNPDAAADSLLIMRVDALGDAPALAAALDDAAKALRKRDNSAIELAWMRVRRSLGRAPLRRDGISVWSAQ